MNGMVPAVWIRLTRPFLLLLLLACKGRSPTSTEKPQGPLGGTADPCSQAVAQAQHDFQNGRYELHSREFLPQPNTYLYVLGQRYHIQWRFVEVDTAGSYYACYDSVLVQHLQRKYGAAFQQRAAHQADSLEATGRWYRAPSYPGGLDRLQPFVWQRVHWARLSAREGRVFASFLVDTTGRLQDVKIQRGLDPSHDQEVLRVLQHMPRWIPAYGAGQAEAQSYMVPIPFSQAIRRQYARSEIHKHG